MKKEICLVLLVVVFLSATNAQLLKITPGGSITVTNGATFHADGLTLMPTANFTITDNELIRTTAVTHTTPNPYIFRVYQFINNTPVFNGNIQINYTDGTELNNIPENVLTLNIHNGTFWNSWLPTTRDATNNFILTNNISSVLNELTLANQSLPLPLNWLWFTATKQDNMALLKWSTAQELNTKNFLIQHSKNSTDWNDIGSVAALGLSTVNNYSFIHTNPKAGVNYYRIKQVDTDNRFTYSLVNKLSFNTAEESFAVLGNPIINKTLIVKANKAMLLSIYAADGKLLFTQNINEGVKYIDLTKCAAGIYLIKTENYTQKIIVQ